MKRIGLAIAALVLALGAAEGWARSVESGLSQKLVSDDRLMLAGDLGELNSAGYRDREWGEKAGTRVVVVGDSMTYGKGLALEEVWPRVAEAVLHDEGLDDGGVDVEVLNLAVSGYDIGQCRATIEQVALGLEPDLLVYAAYVNDGTRTRYVIGPSGPIWVRGGPPSALYRMWRGAKAARDPDMGPFDRHWFQQELRALHASAGDVPVVVYGLAPHEVSDASRCPAQDTAPYCQWLRDVRSWIRDDSVNEGLPYASAYDALVEAGGDYSLTQGDRDHPNAEGHAVIGRDFAAVLSGWLRSGDFARRTDGPPPGP